MPGKTRKKKAGKLFPRWFILLRYLLDEYKQGVLETLHINNNQAYLMKGFSTKVSNYFFPFLHRDTNELMTLGLTKD